MADQVAEVKAKTDIVEVISEYVDLKKAGSNFKGLCPFHSEKTPSFMVSPEIQIYKCFGCDRSGDVYSFLMEYEAMEFPEALKMLADRAGVKLVRKRYSDTSEKEKIIETNTTSLRFYQYVLHKHPAGKVALEYLLKDRGLKRQTILDFALGFAPATAGALEDYLTKKKKVHKALLLKSGTFYARQDRIYDRFGGRVVFPLHDHRGNVVGFAGRLLPKNDNKKLAKYINTPETPVYHKSDLLYGLNIVRSYIRKSRQAILVEGELDVISTYQAGIKNTVAIKGSALTSAQSKLLKRFAEQLVFALDTDDAGIEAALRGIRVAQKDDFDVKVADLGGAKDPDELARTDPVKLRKIITGSVDAWDFVINKIFDKYDASTGSGKAKISREVIPVLTSIDDNIVRSHYVSVVAKKLRVSEEAVFAQLGHIPQKTTDVVEEVPSRKVDRELLLEERLVALVFKRKNTASDYKQEKELIEDNVLKKLLEQYIKYKQNHRKFDPAKFSEALAGELVGVYAKIVLSDELTGENIEKEYESVVLELRELRLKQQLKAVGEDIKKFEKMKEAKKLKSAQRKFSKLTEELNELG